MEDYPDPKYAPRISYLLGQFAQELEQWNEAIRSYDLILRQYPDHTLAPDAQYKLAQCYEQAGEPEQEAFAPGLSSGRHGRRPIGDAVKRNAVGRGRRAVAAIAVCPVTGPLSALASRRIFLQACILSS